MRISDWSSTCALPISLLVLQVNQLGLVQIARNLKENGFPVSFKLRGGEGMVLADDFASAVHANPDRREADALLAERIDNPRLNQITEAAQHALSLLRIILWAPKCRFVKTLRILGLVIVAQTPSAKGMRPQA